MKIIFILSSYATVYLLYAKFKATYDSNHDTFRIEFLLVPVAGLAVLVNHEFNFLEVCAICITNCSKFLVADVYIVIGGL